MRNKLVLAAALAACASLPALAQQDFSKVEIKIEKLAEGVFMLAGSGGNIGVSAGADGVFRAVHEGLQLEGAALARGRAAARAHRWRRDRLF
jgi:hypothetical protein